MAPDRGLSEIGDITRASVRRLKRVSRVGSDGISPLPITSVEGRRRAHWYLPGTTDGLRARKAKAAGHQINPVVAQSKIGRRALDGLYACDFDLRQGRCRGFGCPQRPPLLRMCCKRPCRSHASKEADELACPHSITSSAATSSLSGTVRPSILAVCALMTSSNLVACTQPACPRAWRP